MRTLVGFTARGAEEEPWAWTEEAFRARAANLTGPGPDSAEVLAELLAVFEDLVRPPARWLVWPTPATQPMLT